MRNPDPASAPPITFAPQVLTDLTEAVTLTLLLHLEFFGLAEAPPGLSQRLDRFVAWCGENGTEPGEGLSEALGLTFGPTTGLSQPRG
jgi:hypothetical protein